MVRFLAFAVLTGLTLGLLGCGGGGGSGIKVHGTLLQNGKPITPAPKEEDTLEISLAPADPKNSKLPSTGAIFNPADNTFVFKGQAGVGVPPGEYLVLVRYASYDGSEDRFKDQFNHENSKLKYTVTSERDQEILIDIGKKTVTKVQAK